MAGFSDGGGERGAHLRLQDGTICAGHAGGFPHVGFFHRRKRDDPHVDKQAPQAREDLEVSLFFRIHGDEVDVGSQRQGAAQRLVSPTGGPDDDGVPTGLLADDLSENAHLGLAVTHNQNEHDLLGQVSEADKHAALAMADLFVSTSQHEGFGLVFLEAMAFGLPVICYDHGGQTDFLASGETGHVVSLNDIESFVRAVQMLHADAPLRRRLGAHNRQRVESYFIDTCAAKYEAVFEAALARAAADLRHRKPASP